MRQRALHLASSGRRPITAATSYGAPQARSLEKAEVQKRRSPQSPAGLFVRLAPFREEGMVPRRGLEPPRLAALVPETSASTIPPSGRRASRRRGDKAPDGALSSACFTSKPHQARNIALAPGGRAGPRRIASAAASPPESARALRPSPEPRRFSSFCNWRGSAIGAPPLCGQIGDEARETAQARQNRLAGQMQRHAVQKLAGFVGQIDAQLLAAITAADLRQSGVLPRLGEKEDLAALRPAHRRRELRAGADQIARSRTRRKAGESAREPRFLGLSALPAFIDPIRDPKSPPSP